MKYNKDYKTIDPIDRNESIRRFKYMRELTVEQVVDMLKRVPSCRSKGEWIKATESIWKCSLCKGIMFMESNYCPNCGAEMEGARNE